MPTPEAMDGHAPDGRKRMKTEHDIASISPGTRGKSYGAAVLALVLGMAVSVSAFFVVRSWEDHGVEMELGKGGHHRISALAEVMQSSFMVLESIRAFYCASETVEREEFQAFVKPLLSNRLSIHALEWIPRVPAPHLDAFETTAREEGFPGFRVTERSAQGEMVRAGRRGEYFPVHYVEPCQGNESAPGFDLASDPICKKALDEARDSGAMVATGRLTLVQEHDEQFGVLVVLPVYRKGVSVGSVAERRQHLLGFALGVFRLDHMAESALRYFRQEEIMVFLYDMSAQQGERRLLFLSHGVEDGKPWEDADGAVHRERFSCSHSFDVAGRTWTVVCIPTARFISSLRTFKPWITLASLLLCSIVLGIYFFLNARHRTQLAEAYRNLRGEIEERTRIQASLSESEERFLEMANSIREVFWLFDLDEGSVIYVSPAYEEIWGRSIENLYDGYNEWDDSIHPDDRSIAQESFAKIVETGGGEFREYRIIRPDGAVRWIQDRGFPITGTDGRVGRIAGIAEDITERKRVEEALQKSEALLRETQALTRVGGWQYDVASGRFAGTDEIYRIHEVPLDYEPADLEAWCEFYHPQDRPVFRRAFMKTLESGQPHDLESRFITATGKNLWVRTTARAIFEGGKVVRINGNIRDITARKQVEQALRESEERFRTLVEHAPDGVLVFDVESDRFVQVNESISRLLGYERDEFLCRNWLDISAPTQADGAPVAHGALRLQKEALEGHTAVGEWIFIHADGREILTELRLTRLPSSDRTQVRASVTNIGDRRRLEIRLSQAQRMEAIANLAGGIAHEFNNALSAIVGNMELLEMELPKDMAMDEYLDPMKISVTHMTALTNQLLAYARGGKFHDKTISLSDFVRDAFPPIRHSIDPPVQIKTDLPRDIRAVRADTTQMQMVLSAVLQNASEAVDKDGCITVSVGNEDVDEETAAEHPGLKPGSYVCLTIEDNGKGMDTETKSRIFEPFFTTKFQGRGLGMAAVYGIVKNHDGWISVESKFGEGTVVRIFLPAVSALIDTPTASGGELDMGTGTILLIEDEKMVREVNRKLLETLGYHVLEAETGTEAVRIAETFDGDIGLALLDIVLPDFGGKDLYPLLMKARPDLRVVVCSGYSLDGPAQQILDAGAQDFLQKPFSVAELSAKLKKGLSSR